MNFLQLCQRVARESGVVADGLLTTTVSQSNKLRKVVDWTAEAYADIQRSRGDWSWMFGTFSGTTVASQRAYTGAEMGVASRFSRFMVDTERRTPSGVLCYATAEGRETEWRLQGWTAEDFADNLDYGSRATETGRPTHCAVDHDGTLRLYPTPDATGFTVRGRYRKQPQILASNTEIPEMPEDHHMAIVWQALLFLVTHDEAFQQREDWQANLDRHRSEMLMHYTPRVSLGGPLA